MANESGRKLPNPLIRQVDTLLRNQEAETEVPVLTEVVDAAAKRAALLDPVLLEALARQLERAVLGHFGPEFTRLVVAQRAFQANSRVVSTGDQVMQELVNLIR